MIELRPVETDADLEDWRQVRIAVVPERTPSVSELRASTSPERLLLLARLDGKLAGSSVADRSDIGGRGAVIPCVLPEAHRRGVGTVLLRASAAHVAALGFSKAGTLVGDEGSRAFAERFGFEEVNRDVEQVREVGDEPPAELPDGVAIVSVAERPELWRDVYRTVATEGFETRIWRSSLPSP